MMTGLRAYLVRLFRYIRKVLGIEYVVPASETRSDLFSGHIHEGLFGDIVCHGCGVYEPLPADIDPSWGRKVAKFLAVHRDHGPTLTTIGTPATSHGQPSARETL